MTNEIKTEKLLYIQTLQGFREKALPQLIKYLKKFKYVIEIAEDENNCDEMKAVTIRNFDYSVDFSLSEEFLSGLILFANSIHHNMKLNFVSEYVPVIAIELRPKHHDEVF